MILKCDKCKPHTFQDNRYGLNRRVHCPMKMEKGNERRYRCTVCLTERTKNG